MSRKGTTSSSENELLEDFTPMSFPHTPSPPPTFADKYTLTGGEGSSKIPNHCTEKVTGQVFVVKRVSKEGDKEIRLAKREIDVLYQLPIHPNLVRLHDTFEDSEAFVLVTDFCAGETLHERLKKIGRFNEREAARVMGDILQAIKACHTYRIMIRDLKPKNMAFVEADEASNLKVINFETSILFKPGEKFTNDPAGALLYSAPEVIAKNYGKESDMWSAGIIMYEMLYGKHPFHYDAMRTSEFKKAVCEDRVNFFTYPWPHVIMSDPAMDLIERMLRRDPSSRITVDDALDHYWIRRHA